MTFAEISILMYLIVTFNHLNIIRKNIILVN